MNQDINASCFMLHVSSIVNKVWNDKYNPYK